MIAERRALVVLARKLVRNVDAESLLQLLHAAKRRYERCGMVRLSRGHANECITQNSDDCPVEVDVSSE